MSEESFSGISPRSAAGKEMYFHSLDSWFVILECIVALLGAVPQFRIGIDAVAADRLGRSLRETIQDGRCGECLRGIVAREYADVDEQDEEPLTPQEREERFDGYMDLMDRFVTFLEHCGGCIAE